MRDEFVSMIFIGQENCEVRDIKKGKNKFDDFNFSVTQEIEINRVSISILLKLPLFHGCYNDDYRLIGNYWDRNSHHQRSIGNNYRRTKGHEDVETLAQKKKKEKKGKLSLNWNSI